jgi:hypothetical protein
VAKPRESKASVAEFDAVSADLRAQLKAFWDDETNPATFTTLNVEALGDLWRDGPELDSKAVQNASPIVEELLGFKLTGKFLKRGGYESFDDLVTDLMPKLREECTAETPAMSPARTQPLAARRPTQ